MGPPASLGLNHVEELSQQMKGEELLSSNSVFWCVDLIINKSFKNSSDGEQSFYVGGGVSTIFK